MTHEEGRKRAVKWLVNSAGCGTVLSEIAATSEIPDAIGWHGRSSILVEVKVSRSDFHANKRKPHSAEEKGMGQYRYFMCPSKLIMPEDLDGLDYGLLWMTPHTVRVVKKATRRNVYHKDGEILALASALRRVKAREFIIIVPDERPSAELRQDHCTMLSEEITEEG